MRPLSWPLTPEVHLLEPLILFFLVTYVGAGHLVVASNRRAEVASRPEALVDEVRRFSPYARAKWMALFPSM
jgi:hypothetical protein